MNTYLKEFSSLGHLPCQLDLRKIHSAAITAFTVSYSTLKLPIETNLSTGPLSVPLCNASPVIIYYWNIVPRLSLCRIGFVLGVWLRSWWSQNNICFSFKIWWRWWGLYFGFISSGNTHRPGHTDKGTQAGAHRPGHTGRGTQTRAHRPGYTDKGTQTRAHRQGHTDKGTQAGAHRQGHTGRGTQTRAHRQGHIYTII